MLVSDLSYDIVNLQDEVVKFGSQGLADLSSKSSTLNCKKWSWRNVSLFSLTNLCPGSPALNLLQPTRTMHRQLQIKMLLGVEWIG